MAAYLSSASGAADSRVEAGARPQSGESSAVPGAEIEAPEVAVVHQFSWVVDVKQAHQVSQLVQDGSTQSPAMGPCSSGSSRGVAQSKTTGSWRGCNSCSRLHGRT